MDLSKELRVRGGVILCKGVLSTQSSADKFIEKQNQTGRASGGMKTTRRRARVTRRRVLKRLAPLFW